MANSLWTRIRKFLRPEAETYETRRVRPGADGPDALPEQYGRTTDQRRHGGTGAIGG